MKFSNILAIGFLSMSLISYGQKIKLGPELGFNIIPMSSNELGTNYQPGFQLGANIEYHFGDHFSLRSGVFATQKRQSFQSHDSVLVNLFGLEELIGNESLNLNSYTTIDRNVTQTYIEIPLVASYNYKQFSFFAGPYFGYMVASRQRELRTIDTPFLRAINLGSFLPDGLDTDLLLAFLPPGKQTTFSESNSSSTLRSFDMGIKAGVRYQWDDLGLNVNYQYGFFDYETTSKDAFENHSYLQVTLNYNFGIGRK